MTYNEWRDELKNNLLSVSEVERNQVLDYYAEAYADRRDAGFSEKDIIVEFGAPYDAAQRVLGNFFVEDGALLPVEGKVKPPKSLPSKEDTTALNNTRGAENGDERPAPDKGGRKTASAAKLFSKRTIVIALTLALIILAAAIVLPIVFAYKGVSWGEASPWDTSRIVYSRSSPYKNIKFNIEAGNVIIRSVESSDIAVTYPVGDGLRFDGVNNADGDELDLSLLKTGLHASAYYGQDLPVMTVDVPQSVGVVELTVGSAATVTVEGGAYGELNAVVKGGSLALNGVNSNSADISLRGGELRTVGMASKSPLTAE